MFDFVSPQISSIETSGALQIDNDYESSDNSIYQYIPDLPDNIQIAPLVTNKQIQDDPELIGEREMQVCFYLGFRSGTVRFLETNMKYHFSPPLEENWTHMPVGLKTKIQDISKIILLKHC